MAEKEMFLLHFNSFERNICSTWQNLQADKNFSDVTIACDDNPNHQIQAHKIILSSFSPVFSHLLQLNPGQKPLLYLRGVKYEELADMIDYIYKGEVNIVTDELNNFIALAKDLKIKGLTEEMDRNAELILNNSNPRIKYPHCEAETIDLSKSPPKSPEKRKSATIESPMKDESIHSASTTKKDDDCIEFQEEHDDKEDEEKYETFPPHMTTLTKEEQEPTEEDEEITRLAWEESMLSQEEEDDDQRGKRKQGNSPRQDVAYYTCEHCNYKTPRKYNLQQHVGSMHEGVRYSCEQCNFKTPRRYNLAQHIECMHEGVRYKCDHCDYNATKKAYLKIHVAKKHSQFLKN